MVSIPAVNGIERFFAEAAYTAALLLWLVENKSDHQADAEIADILKEKPYMMGIVFSVLESAI